MLKKFEAAMKEYTTMVSVYPTKHTRTIKQPVKVLWNPKEPTHFDKDGNATQIKGSYVKDKHGLL